MLPSKSHLQVIVKELEKFESNLEKSYNFVDFIDRCKGIFPPPIQKDLNVKIADFKLKFHIDILTAQDVIHKVKVKGRYGNYVLKLKYDEGGSKRIPLYINSVEYGLRGIIVWCRKHIIKLIKDEQVDFSNVPKIDLESS